MNARKLTDEVVNVMADVLVHQRARWGPLLGHKRQLEGWWRAEMVLADIVVARLTEDLEDFDYKATPRLWIELKGRATWWGTTPGRAAKATSC